MNICGANNISFQANCRHVFDNNNKLLYRTTTFFYREDLNWNAFSRLLCDKYQKAENVNVVNHACSNGMETLTLVMSLLKRGYVATKKFFPILAKDIDKENISMANSGKYRVDYADILNIHAKNPADFNYFFTVFKKPIQHQYDIEAKKLIKDRIRYSIGDIFNDIDQMSSDNTVLFFRNVWPYLKKDAQIKLLDKITEKLNSSSLFVIGKYDNKNIKDTNIALMLKERGFKEIMQNVFEKE